MNAEAVISCLCAFTYGNESKGCHVIRQALKFSTSLIKENLLFERNKENMYYRKAMWKSVADTRLRCTRAAFQFLTDLLGGCNPSVLAAPVWVSELICGHPKTHTRESGICQFGYFICATQSITAVCCDPTLPGIPTPIWKPIVLTEIQGWLRLLATQQNLNKIIA